MRFENVSKVEKGFIEKSLIIENQKDGMYRITAKSTPTGKKKEQLIEMTFSQNAFNALVGTWLMFADKEATE